MPTPQAGAWPWTTFTIWKCRTRWALGATCSNWEPLARAHIKPLSTSFRSSHPTRYGLLVPNLSVAKRGYASKKITWRELFQCFLCQLKASVLWHIMRRKQRALLHVSYALMSRWTYLCQYPKDKQLTRSLIRSSTSQLVNFPTRPLAHSSTRQLFRSSTCPLVNFSSSQLVNLSARQLVLSSAIVIFSVRILTLWVLFLPPIVHLVAKNRFSRRFVLMQIKGSCTYGQNEYLLK